MGLVAMRINLPAHQVKEYGRSGISPRGNRPVLCPIKNKSVSSSRSHSKRFMFLPETSAGQRLSLGIRNTWQAACQTGAITFGEFESLGKRRGFRQNILI